MPVASPVAHLPSASADLLRSLKVCFLAGTLGQGGAERQLYYTLKCLKECGAEVNLLCLTKGEHWEARIQKLGVTIHHVGGSDSRFWRLLHVFQIIRRLRPHVVQSQHFYTSIYAAVAGRCLGIPSIGAVRSDGFWERKTNGRFWFNLLLVSPHWIAANSQKAIENLCSLGHNLEKFLLIPNVIDTEVFRPVAQPSSANEFVILGVGSLEQAKRFDRLLAIASALRTRINRDVRVVIAGDGRQREAIQTLAEQTRQQGVSVELVGRVPDPLPLFQRANALLLTSDREGTPNVIMEAMACSLPVVATNVGGIPDLIKHGNTGFLFAPEDIASAVRALEQVASDSGLAVQIGAHARSFIEEHHSLDLLPGILAGLYEKVLATNHSRCH